MLLPPDWTQLYKGCYTQVDRDGQLQLGLLLNNLHGAASQPRVLLKGDLSTLICEPTELRLFGGLRLKDDGPGPGKETFKQILTSDYVKHRNVKEFPHTKTEGGKLFQAMISLPSRGNFVVGEHPLQAVAACIADDAAQLAQDAGLKASSGLQASSEEAQHRYFDTKTREMVLQYLGGPEVPAPVINWLPGEIEALKQGRVRKRSQPSAAAAPDTSCVPDAGSSRSAV